MDQKFDVITIGRITLDIFLSIDDSNKHFRLNKENNELCIKNGDKAIIDKADFLVGGNAANVVVGLSRLGINSAIIAEIGEDSFSDKIIQELKKEKVFEGFIKKSGNSSSFSIIINYLGERTIFEEVSKTENDFSLENINTDWIYLTSVCNDWKSSYTKVLHFLNEKNIKLIFNPGTSQLDEGLDALREIITKSEILFLNKEEASNLVGIGAKDAINKEELVRRIKDLGAKNVVITDGINGSFGMDADSSFHEQEIIKTEVAERTGAGDAYASGFTAAIIKGYNFKDAMLWGTKNAASAISIVGAQPGLLTEDKISN